MIAWVFLIYLRIYTYTISNHDEDDIVHKRSNDVHDNDNYEDESDKKDDDDSDDENHDDDKDVDI